MNFLCDVHISYKLVRYLRSEGHFASHVNELPEKWNTKDAEICIFADSNNLILITKDLDFRNSFFLRKSPAKLIRVILGNISNDDLVDLFKRHLTTISILSIETSFYLELGKTSSVYVS